ncbi:MAG TPA: hypothetical protein PLE19_10235 [Planctomycetota bacterium]|nr:hypothetical protein [Planctomycetota bacterium]HRR80991.1 hypothetical protein [Planctomycetota bacterium]HRT93651.1 hypothetical protein [Planctomycetota bacterium]
MRCRVHCVCLAVLACGLLARADLVHLADGTTREGRVLEQNEREIVLEVGQGGVTLAVRLPRSQVVRIEEKAAPGAVVMAEYVARLSEALKSKNADHWLALGLWCRERPGFRDKADEALRRALELDPNHVQTRLLLGHVRVNDAWMTRQQAIQAIAPEIEQNAKLRELELQAQLEDARTDALEAEARAKALEAKIAELRKDIEDLRQRLAMPPLPAEYFRPRSLYRPVIILPPRSPRGPHKPDGKDAPKAEPSPKGSPPKNAPPEKTLPKGDTADTETAEK